MAAARLASRTLALRALPPMPHVPPPSTRDCAGRGGPEQARAARRAPQGETAPADDIRASAAPEVLAALGRLEAIDSALSASVRVPGTPLRFGWNTALGRVPFAGALAHSAIGAYALATAWRFDAGPALVGRLAFNLAVGGAVRAIPLVGPWLAPSLAGGAARSVALLRDHIASEAGLPSAPGSHKGGALADGARALGRLRKAGGLVRTLTWPLRHLSLGALLALAVTLPLAAWLGSVGFLGWAVVRLLGFA